MSESCSFLERSSVRFTHGDLCMHSIWYSWVDILYVLWDLCLRQTTAFMRVFCSAGLGRPALHKSGCSAVESIGAEDNRMCHDDLCFFQGLRAMDKNGLSDPYCKLHLLPGASKVRHPPYSSFTDNLMSWNYPIWCILLAVFQATHENHAQDTEPWLEWNPDLLWDHRRWL